MCRCDWSGPQKQGGRELSPLRNAPTQAAHPSARLRNAPFLLSPMVLELVKVSLVIASATTVPLTPTVSDTVDVIELNHVYDGEGHLVFSQLIFWDWEVPASRQHVVAWRVWKPGRPTPMRNWSKLAYNKKTATRTLTGNECQVRMRILVAVFFTGSGLTI